jgi:methionyl-tRNA formyltransferase
MKNMSKKVIFFGTEDFSLVALQGLVEAGYSVAAVVTKPDSKRGRNQQLTQPAVKVYATAHNIPVWQPTKLSDISDDIKNLGDIAGVLVSYGKIVPENIINLFKPGIINVHPSLLPLYRGPSPIESAIMNGDLQTGVSIMQLTAKMDAGPVYTQTAYTLSGHESKLELYSQLASIGTRLLIESLPDILAGSLQPTAQDEDAATYCQLLQKDDSTLVPDNLTAGQAERKVRAHLGFPKTKVNILGNTVIITKAHISSESKTPLDIRCQDGAYLSIDELIAPSGRLMNAQAFLNGYAAA